MFSFNSLFRQLNSVKFCLEGSVSFHEQTDKPYNRIRFIHNSHNAQSFPHLLLRAKCTHEFHPIVIFMLMLRMRLS